MSWVATENFNSLTNGDLNGQGSGSGWSANWTASATVDVQDSIVQEGAKAIYFNNPLDGDYAWRPLTTDVDTGNVVMYIRRPNKDYYFRVILLDDANYYIALVEFGPSHLTFGRIVEDASWCQILVANYNINQWYKVEIEVNCTSNSHRARVDDGTWCNPHGDIDAGAGLVGKIFFRTDKGINANAYVDNIGPFAAPPARGNLNLQTLLGVGH